MPNKHRTNRYQLVVVKTRWLNPVHFTILRLNTVYWKKFNLFRPRLLLLHAFRFPNQKGVDAAVLLAAGGHKHGWWPHPTRYHGYRRGANGVRPGPSYLAFDISPRPSFLLLTTQHEPSRPFRWRSHGIRYFASLEFTPLSTNIISL